MTPPPPPGNPPPDRLPLIERMQSAHLELSRIEADSAESDATPTDDANGESPAVSAAPLPPMPLGLDRARRDRVLSGLVGIDEEPSPTWWAPGDPAPLATPRTAGPPPAEPRHRQPAEGVSAVPVWTSESPPGSPPLTGHRLPGVDLDEADAGEALEAGLPAGPIRAPKPSLFERFKERIAVRRALSGAFRDDLDDSVEVVSGAGAPLRPHSRADLQRRRGEALRPAVAEVPPAPPAPPRVQGHVLPPTATTVAPPSPPRPPVMPHRPQPGLREVLPPPARPSSNQPPARHHPVSGIATPPGRGIVEVESVTHRVTREPWSVPGPRDEELRPARPSSPQYTPSDRRESRRVMTLVVAGLAAIFVVGMISGRTTTRLPLTPATSPASQPVSGAQAQVPAPAQGAQPAAPQPSAQAPAPAPASQQPPAVAPAPAGPVTIGSGGIGWKVDDFRFGDHKTYYRVVLDLGPVGATPPDASPSVTVTTQDAQHILLTIDGTSPPDAAPALPPGAVITAMTLTTHAHGSSSITYLITVAHPVSVHPSLLTGPMRLLLDFS